MSSESAFKIISPIIQMSLPNTIINIALSRDDTTTVRLEDNDLIIDYTSKIHHYLMLDN